MKDFEIIKDLIGNSLTEADLAFVDCYVRPQLGIFIPTAGECGYAAKPGHSHPSYMIVISFEPAANRHYPAEIASPHIPHDDKAGLNYYCLLIEKSYFEKRYLMYAESVPTFNEQSFEICSDILKALNTFVFEYSKSMPNSDITLDAQAEIITHWIIRSIMGETFDMRAVSSDYSVARAQHYMEQHYSENITVSKLAALGYVSSSCLNRKFKKETGITPIEYLIEIRLERAKTMLKRKNISVTEIAMKCGFGSSAHFSSCFQNRVGISPTEYRDKYIG
ncbi:helix-turn-helix domain-containing protein [Huintestinicola sp.]|uniref:helix-turn-helix domain-containing protein n=1 Tax=Huintestinicola sp. TaxID=2981661 RepID=UPI003D7E1D94